LHRALIRGVPFLHAERRRLSRARPIVCLPCSIAFRILEVALGFGTTSRLKLVSNWNSS